MSHYPSNGADFSKQGPPNFKFINFSFQNFADPSINAQQQQQFKYSNPQAMGQFLTNQMMVPTGPQNGTLLSQNRQQLEKSVEEKELIEVENEKGYLPFKVLENIISFLPIFPTLSSLTRVNLQWHIICENAWHKKGITQIYFKSVPGKIGNKSPIFKALCKKTTTVSAILQKKQKNKDARFIAYLQQLQKECDKKRVPLIKKKENVIKSHQITGNSQSIDNQNFHTFSVFPPQQMPQNEQNNNNSANPKTNLHDEQDEVISDFFLNFLNSIELTSSFTKYSRIKTRNASNATNGTFEEIVFNNVQNLSIKKLFESPSLSKETKRIIFINCTFTCKQLNTFFECLHNFNTQLAATGTSTVHKVAAILSHDNQSSCTTKSATTASGGNLVQMAQTQIQAQSVTSGPTIPSSLLTHQPSSENFCFMEKIEFIGCQFIVPHGKQKSEIIQNYKLNTRFAGTYNHEFLDAFAKHHNRGGSFHEDDVNDDSDYEAENTTFQPSEKNKIIVIQPQGILTANNTQQVLQQQNFHLHSNSSARQRSLSKKKKKIPKFFKIVFFFCDWQKENSNLRSDKAKNKKRGRPPKKKEDENGAEDAFGDEDAFEDGVTCSPNDFSSNNNDGQPEIDKKWLKIIPLDRLSYPTRNFSESENYFDEENDKILQICEYKDIFHCPVALSSPKAKKFVEKTLAYIRKLIVKYGIDMFDDSFLEDDASLFCMIARMGHPSIFNVCCQYFNRTSAILNEEYEKMSENEKYITINALNSEASSPSQHQAQLFSRQNPNNSQQSGFLAGIPNFGGAISRQGAENLINPDFQKNATHQLLLIPNYEHDEILTSNLLHNVLIFNRHHRNEIIPFLFVKRPSIGYETLVSVLPSNSSVGTVNTQTKTPPNDSRGSSPEAESSPVGSPNSAASATDGAFGLQSVGTNVDNSYPTFNPRNFVVSNAREASKTRRVALLKVDNSESEIPDKNCCDNIVLAACYVGNLELLKYIIETANIPIGLSEQDVLVALNDQNNEKNEDEQDEEQNIEEKPQYSSNSHLHQSKTTMDTPLHVACRGGFLDVIEYLLENKNYPIDVLNAKQQSCLHSCVDGTNRGTESEEEIAIIDVLLKRIKNSLSAQKQNNVISKIDSNGNTALHIACIRGCKKIVSMLLETAGGIRSIFQQNMNGFIPATVVLHTTMKNSLPETLDNVVDVVNQILSKKPEIMSARLKSIRLTGKPIGMDLGIVLSDLDDPSASSILGYASSHQQKTLELASGTNGERKGTLATKPAISPVVGDTSLFHELLLALPELSLRVFRKYFNLNPNSPLTTKEEHLIYSNYSEKNQEESSLADKREIIQNYLQFKNSDGKTALFILAENISSPNDYSRVVQLLLDLGANVNEIDNLGRAPLQVSLDILTKKYVNFSVSQTTSSGSTAPAANPNTPLIGTGKSHPQNYYSYAAFPNPLQQNPLKNNEQTTQPQPWPTIYYNNNNQPKRVNSNNASSNNNSNNNQEKQPKIVSLVEQTQFLEQAEYDFIVPLMRSPDLDSTHKDSNGQTYLHMVAKFPQKNAELIKIFVEKAEKPFNPKARDAFGNTPLMATLLHQKFRNALELITPETVNEINEEHSLAPLIVALSNKNLIDTVYDLLKPFQLPQQHMQLQVQQHQQKILQVQQQIQLQQQQLLSYDQLNAAVLASLSGIPAFTAAQQQLQNQQIHQTLQQQLQHLQQQQQILNQAFDISGGYIIKFALNNLQQQFRNECVRRIVQNGADLAAFEPTDEDQPTALILGVERQLPAEIIESIITAGAIKPEINYKTKKTSLTALHMACELASDTNVRALEVVEVLLKNGISQFVPDATNSIPMIYALVNDHQVCCSMLLYYLHPSHIPASPITVKALLKMLKLKKLLWAAKKTAIPSYPEMINSTKTTQISLPFLDAVSASHPDLENPITKDESELNVHIQKLEEICQCMSQNNMTDDEILDQLSEKWINKLKEHPETQSQRQSDNDQRAISLLQNLGDIEKELLILELLKQNMFVNLVADIIAHQMKREKQAISLIPEQKNNEIESSNNKLMIYVDRDEDGMSAFHVACREGLLEVVDHYLQLFKLFKQIEFTILDPPPPRNVSGQKRSVDKALEKMLTVEKKPVFEDDLLNNPNIPRNFMNEDELTIADNPIPGISSVPNSSSGHKKQFIYVKTLNPVKFMLNNLYDDFHNLPIHVVMMETSTKKGKFDEKLEIISLLVNAGADLNGKHVHNIDGDTPLHLACRRGKSILADALLKQYKADPEAKNRKKQTPEEIANSMGHYSLMSKLTFDYYEEKMKHENIALGKYGKYDLEDEENCKNSNGNDDNDENYENNENDEDEADHYLASRPRRTKQQQKPTQPLQQTQQAQLIPAIPQPQKVTKTVEKPPKPKVCSAPTSKNGKNLTKKGKKRKRKHKIGEDREDSDEDFAMEQHEDEEDEDHMIDEDDDFLYYGTGTTSSSKRRRTNSSSKRSNKNHQQQHYQQQQQKQRKQSTSSAGSSASSTPNISNVSPPAIMNNSNIVNVNAGNVPTNSSQNQTNVIANSAISVKAAIIPPPPIPTVSTDNPTQNPSATFLSRMLPSQLAANSNPAMANFLATFLQQRPQLQQSQAQQQQTQQAQIQQAQQQQQFVANMNFAAQQQQQQNQQQQSQVQQRNMNPLMSNMAQQQQIIGLPQEYLQQMFANTAQRNFSAQQHQIPALAQQTRVGMGLPVMASIQQAQQQQQLFQQQQQHQNQKQQQQQQQQSRFNI